MPDDQPPTPDPLPPEQSTLLGSVPPGEMFARGMQSVKMTAGADGTWQPPGIEEAAGLFSGYEVLRLLGRGGMGAVYQARQIELDRLVAIKLLPLEISVDKDFADRFRREARAMAKLDHPNIIAVHDFGKTSAGHLYFAMAYVEGANLADIIHQVGLDPDQALSIAEQVCHALSYAHDKGIIHRDIKPANVMVDTASHVKVADFGLARLLDARASDLGHTMTGTVMGTPDYMAPEQMQGMDVDHRADIYSVGVMIYEMLCRQVPRGVFQPPSLRTGCDPRIDELVLKAMQQAPEHRYQSTREMKGEVTATRLALAEPAPQVLALRPTRAPQVSARPIVLQRVAWSAPAKSKLPLYAILTVVVLALAAGAFFLFKPKEEKLTLAQIYAREHPGQTVQDDGPSVGQAPRLPDGGSPPPPASGALALQSFLAEATKDKPFVNSLGLKFVPVPIASGPTAGQRVLFGVWDVRVQDYAVYAAANPKLYGGWKMKQKDGVPAGRELDHPVVGVSWEDAQAFCQWLTEKEQAEGRLPKGLKYRLPSDEEWSWAVGLPPEVGTTPAEKSGKNSVDFPWGKDYPPKGKVDNYADETFHAKFPLDENAKNDWSKNHWIEGYTDGYATTSPVGSFPANAYGLYDMGGNVWQWCEDWFDKDHKDRVLRGAAWDENVRGLLLASTRSRHAPAFRTFNIGFRCVLGASDLPAPGAAENRREALPALPTKQDATSADVLSKASRAMPFENTLGMKFVPVPIVSGPTVGQRVLFGVWDVRVQDYAVYAAANPKLYGGWKMKQKDGVPAGRELDHPVVGVSWEDAQAFCQWLTEKEQAEGRLPKGLKYRLPSDEEWSWAVGLPPEVGTTPAEKSGKNSVDFPWGKDYPPKGKVDNYADETFHAKFPLDENAKNDWSKNHWIEGYTDGYATTSPVGSFPANAYGLYDMGGNVWQWCEDWFDASHKDRVLRGASWHDDGRGNLLSSYRNRNVPTTRSDYYGIRCVVGASDLPATGPAESRREALPALPTKQDATSADVLSKASRAVPFENTLGMKFVPVPIASGPTAGQRVLFGVWDVRVQDYAVYAAANPKVDGGWKTQQKDGVPAGRELDHPVVGVSWEDAQAFCQWLTAKEIAEGKLPKGLRYRLPSDEEWSWAVGLPPELGTTPAEKSGKNSADFPWGRDYPPARKVGNYADEAFHAKFPAKQIPWIEGYNDGYGTTSPVGSFPANAYGLYDMGGNVWQWCEDWFAASHEERVLRGASWADRDRRLLSSNRLQNVPACRYYTYGFRCVLSASDLPAPGPASLRAAAAAALEPNAIRLWDAATKVPTTPTSRWEEDAVRLDTGMLRLETLPSRDAIIRAKIRMNPEARTPQIGLRLSPTKKFTFYRLGVLPDKNRVSLEVSVEGKGTQLKGWPLPRAYAPEEWLTLELRAVGDQLTATLDGTVLGVVSDSTITEAGGAMIYGGGASYLRDVVYVPLDQPGSRANSPTTATRDVPFENTLGMKFVPVPIASGPTAGQQVLFGVWDVRMQDYGVYAAANPKVDGSWKTQQKDGVPVGRELNHPVVAVSWDEAQAFCQWLTEKEQAEGKLPKGLKYRLPSDEEWSWAVGLPLESGRMPSEKIGKNNVDFPWGKEYPPTTKVGNYADEAYHAQFPLVKNEKENRMDNQWIEGYDDGYATTSPVGSFPANAYGLYDMSGNVWQWCEDWIDVTYKERVLRGASWSYLDRTNLLSSSRNRRAPNAHLDFIGFRCVLGASAP